MNTPFETKNVFRALVLLAVIALSAAFFVPEAVAGQDSLRELKALQKEYAQLMEDFKNGEATLQELAAVQRKLSELRARQEVGTFVSDRLIMLAKLQREYKKLLDAFKDGKATLQQLAEIQRQLSELASQTEDDTFVSDRLIRLGELQRELKQLMADYKDGKATLQDLAAFQRKWSAFMDELDGDTSDDPKIAAASTAPARAAVEPASWGEIKSRFQ